jgi:hypothetical protein
VIDETVHRVLISIGYFCSVLQNRMKFPIKLQRKLIPEKCSPTFLLHLMNVYVMGMSFTGELRD